jgi:hypothetical protein
VEDTHQKGCVRVRMTGVAMSFVSHRRDGVNVRMIVLHQTVRVRMGVDVTPQCVVKTPETDANQHDPDGALAPRRDGLDGEPTSKPECQQADEDHAQGMAQTPQQASEPGRAALLVRDGRDRGEVIGPGQHVDEPGNRAGKS